MQHTFTALLSAVIAVQAFELISLRRSTAGGSGYTLVFTLIDDKLKKVKGTRTLYDISLFIDVDDLLDELWYTEKLRYIK